jgi:hypothetical protein
VCFSIYVRLFIEIFPSPTVDLKVPAAYTKYRNILLPLWLRRISTTISSWLPRPLFSTGPLDQESERHSMEFVLVTKALQTPFPRASHFSSGAIHSLSRKERLILDRKAGDLRQPQSSDRSFPDSISSTAPSSPQLSYSSCSCQVSYSSTLASSLSMDSRDLWDDDDDIAFPSYDASVLSFVPVQISQPSPKQDDDQPQSNPAVEATTFLRKTTQDDQAIQSEPTSHADYLSHEWKEEDIWLSWSYVVHKRRNLANSARLENALWRSWVKAKYHLITVRPEILSWVKDCDVTWLYGPLQTNGKETHSMSNASPPLSHMSRSSSFSKKSILKRNPRMQQFWKGHNTLSCKV